MKLKTLIFMIKFITTWTSIPYNIFHFMNMNNIHINNNLATRWKPNNNNNNKYMKIKKKHIGF